MEYEPRRISVCRSARPGIELLHYKPEIGFELDELYVNAGVLVLNLAEMRREGLFANCALRRRNWRGGYVFRTRILSISSAGGGFSSCPIGSISPRSMFATIPTGVPGLLSSTTPAPGNPGRLRSAPMP